MFTRARKAWFPIANLGLAIVGWNPSAIKNRQRQSAIGNVLCRQALPGNHFHQITESIKLAKGRVDIWCDADALKLFVHDWSCKHSMFVEQVAADCSGLNAFHFNVRNRTRLIRIKRRVESDL